MKISEAFTNLDRDVVKYLKERSGKQIPNSILAKHFEVSEAEMRAALERQLKAKKIRTEMISGRRKFFVPLVEQVAAPVVIEAPRRVHGSLVMPQPMMDLYARIRQERAAYPSKFES